MRPVIIVFAKAPLPGRVKTRLIPPLTPDDAVELHLAFVRDTLESLVSLTGQADIELHTDIETDAWNDMQVPRRIQYEGDLGLKMLKALSSALDRGHPQAMILGSDSPSLPVSHVQAILDLDSDIALGPADDGGYYAIAARRTTGELFSGVRWSTPNALQDTMWSCLAAGLSCQLGPAWFDVDDEAGLWHLRASLLVPRHTALALETILSSLVDSRPAKPTQSKPA